MEVRLLVFSFFFFIVIDLLKEVVDCESWFIILFYVAVSPAYYSNCSSGTYVCILRNMSTKNNKKWVTFYKFVQMTENKLNIWAMFYVFSQAIFFFLMFQILLWKICKTNCKLEIAEICLDRFVMNHYRCLFCVPMKQFQFLYVSGILSLGICLLLAVVCYFMISSISGTSKLAFWPYY